MYKYMSRISARHLSVGSIVATTPALPNTAMLLRTTLLYYVLLASASLVSFFSLSPFFDLSRDNSPPTPHLWLSATLRRLRSVFPEWAVWSGSWSFCLFGARPAVPSRGCSSAALRPFFFKLSSRGLQALGLRSRLPATSPRGLSVPESPGHGCLPPELVLVTAPPPR